MVATLISEMKHLQAEIARLKCMYADMAMQNELVKENSLRKIMRSSIISGYCVAISREISDERWPIIPLCQGCCPLLYLSLIFRWAG